MTVIDTAIRPRPTESVGRGPAVLRHPHDAATLGTVLGVWAHPDDEAYLAAALMALAAEAGNRVVCVTATRGEHGTDDPVAMPPHRLAAVREREIRASLAVLGVEEHRWLDYEDGTCAAADPARAVAAVGEIIRQVRPDTIVTFGPDGITGHPDHVAVGRWTTIAATRAVLPRAPRLLYPTSTDHWADRWAWLHGQVPVYGPEGPPRTPEHELALAVEPSTAVLDRKLAALRAQASQTTWLMDHVGEATYRDWWSRECYVEAPSSGLRHRAASRG